MGTFKIGAVLISLALFSGVLAGCSSEEATPVIKEVTRVVQQEVVKEVTKQVPQTVVVEKPVPQTVVVEKIVEKQAPPLAGFQRGGFLVRGQPNEITTMDPHVESLLQNWRFRGATYASLFELSPKDMSAQLGLAESWSFTNPTTLQIKLMKSAKFHDGSEVTAADVKFTLERAIDPKTGAWVRVYALPITNIEIVDKYTLNLKLSAPSLGTPINLWYVGIVSKATVEREGAPWLKSHENGAGAFKVDSWKPDVEMRLLRHDGYYKAGQPYADGLTVKIIPDESTVVAALRTGQIDHAKLEDNKNFRLLQTNPNLVIYQTASMGTYYININHWQPTLQDVRVRRALSLAMNRDDILKSVGVGLGAVSGVIPPALKAYWAPPENLPYMVQDLDKAKKLLAEAGFANGFDLPIITIASNTTMTQIAELLAAQWSQVGIRAEVRPLETAQWVEDLTKTRKYFISTNSTFKMPDPEGLFLRYMHSKGDGTINSGWKDAQMDQLVEQASQELDPAKRVELFRKVQNMIADKVQSLSSYSPIEVDVTQKYVKNFEPHPITIQFSFDQVWLEKK